jgi:hypothetical protein
MASDATVGWFNFGGSAKQNTNNFYYNSVTPVVVVEGTNCVQTYPAGVWNGFFQDRPAQPGQVYTADCWFLTPTEDPIAGSNTCYLEVQFRNAADGVLVQYASATFDTNFPLATWVKLTPTNINSGDFTTFLGTSQYLVAPAGTAKLRYQITYHGLGGPGSVYVDAARLMLEETPVTATSSAGNVQLTFPTIYGINYQVYYRTSLTETVWHTLGSPVPGTGGLKTVSDSTSGAARFYTVNTQ